MLTNDDVNFEQLDPGLPNCVFYGCDPLLLLTFLLTYSETSESIITRKQNEVAYFYGNEQQRRQSIDANSTANLRL